MNPTSESKIARTASKFKIHAEFNKYFSYISYGRNP